MKKTKDNTTYVVVTKEGDFVQGIDPFLTCSSEAAAKYFTKAEADAVVNELAEQHFIYGVKAKLIEIPAVKKSRKGIGGIPKGCTWVFVNGKRKLVRPGEQAPISPISPISPNDNIGNSDNLQKTAKDCEELRTTANNCGELTWKDIKLIVRRADHLLDQ